jgi:galactokinase
MYRVVHGNPTPDAQDFIDLLNNLHDRHHRIFWHCDLFDANTDVIVCRAPGRLDLMGGIADYSGSHVLEFPIAEATFAAVQRRPERELNVVTLLEDESRSLLFRMSLSMFDGPIEYEAARESFQRYGNDNRWPAYVAGVFLVLMRERKVRFPSGADILISSRVPLGKGVSSSAALEVAVMQAVVKAFDINIEGRGLALLCQKVENLVVGAPCGVMDQMTSVFGEHGRLLFLHCQPAKLKRMITLPDDLMLWGIDSGIRHSVGGARYRSVRAGAFMGLQIIGGNKKYLASITPREFENNYLPKLPERMSGAEFLARYKKTSDPITSIDPKKSYSIRAPTAHPIYENARVQHFVKLLDRCAGGVVSERICGELGELMYASHRSYTALRLGSAGTDLIVDLVRREGSGRLFGAKITGGGSGGTVAVLGRKIANAAVKRIAAAYARETGHRPFIFSGSSSGSLAFNHLRLRPE